MPKSNQKQQPEDTTIDNVLALSAFPPEVPDQLKLMLNPIEEAEREMQAAKDIYKETVKEITTTYRFNAGQLSLARKLAKMKNTGVRTGYVAVVIQLTKMLGGDIDMRYLQEAHPGEGYEDADGPVFDNTASASKAAGPVERAPRERADTDAPIAASEPTPAIPLEEAQRRFEENAHKAPKPTFPTEEEVEAKKAAIAAQRVEDEQAFEGGEAETNVVPMKKTRGRKPGSKNKPKTTAVDTATLADRYVADQEERLAAPTAAEKAPEPPPAPAATRVDDDDFPDADAPAVPAFVKGDHGPTADDLEVPAFLKRDSGSTKPMPGANPTWRSTHETHAETA